MRPIKHEARVLNITGRHSSPGIRYCTVGKLVTMMEEGCKIGIDVMT
jgi:hypothetical protein